MKPVVNWLIIICSYIQIKPLVLPTKQIMEVSINEYDWHEIFPKGIIFFIALLYYNAIFKTKQSWYSMLARVLTRIVFWYSKKQCWRNSCCLGSSNTCTILPFKFESLFLWDITLFSSLYFLEKFWTWYCCFYYYFPPGVFYGHTDMVFYILYNLWWCLWYCASSWWGEMWVLHHY